MFPCGPRRRCRAERFGIGALTRPTAPCEGAPPRRWHSRLGARGRPVVDAVAREARRDRRTPEVPTRPPEADGAARAVTRPVFARAPRPRAWAAGGSRAGHREEVCNSAAHHGDEESRGSLPRVSRDISRVVWPHISPELGCSRLRWLPWQGLVREYVSPYCGTWYRRLERETL